MKKADPGKGKSGRPRKKKTKEKRRKAAPLAAKTLAKKPAKKRDKKKRGWVWSKTKRKAVRLILEGKQVKEIAKDCDIHRNTVRNWMQAPEFVTTLMTRLEEFKVSKRFARLKLTSKTVDNIGTIIEDMLEQRASGEVPEDEFNLYDYDSLSGWLKEWRAMRQEERKDFGDHVEKIEKRIGVHIEGGIGLFGQVNHTHTHDVSLVDAMKQAIPVGTVIEAESIEEATGDALMIAATHEGLLDTILEEEAAQMESGK